MILNDDQIREAAAARRLDISRVRADAEWCKAAGPCVAYGHCQHLTGPFASGQVVLPVCSITVQRVCAGE